MDIAAFTVSTILNVGALSNHSGSGFVQHIAFEPNYYSTGSIYPNFSWLAENTRTGQKYIIVNPQTTLFEKNLDFIKSTFSLTEEELAKSIGVTRKTLLNWKKQESEPNKDKTQKVFDLYLLAKNWEKSQFPTSTIQLNSPVLAGQSIKDMLLDLESNSEKILFAGNRLMHRSVGEVDLI